MIRTCLEDNGSFPPKISEQTSWSQQASTLSTETNNLSFQAAYWHHVCFAISSRQLKRELQKLMLKRPLAAKVHECMRTGMTFTLCNDQLNHNVSSRSIMPTGQNHVKITLSTQLHVKVIFHRWQLPTHIIIQIILTLFSIFFIFPHSKERVDYQERSASVFLITYFSTPDPVVGIISYLGLQSNLKWWQESDPWKSNKLNPISDCL